MFNDLVQQIVSVLRYIASPAVGFLMVFLTDDKHGIAQAVAEVVWPWNGPPSTWLMAGFLAVAGVTVYFAHRTLFHRLVTKRLVEHHARKLSVERTAGEELLDTLAFARWERRGSAANSSKQSVQSVLDESNAAIHFFYCSGWSAILFALILRFGFPNNYKPTFSAWIVFGVIVVGLFVTALIGDSRTARLDMEAYLRFKK